MGFAHDRHRNTVRIQIRELLYRIGIDRGFAIWLRCFKYSPQYCCSDWDFVFHLSVAGLRDRCLPERYEAGAKLRRLPVLCLLLSNDSCGTDSARRATAAAASLAPCAR